MWTYLEFQDDRRGRESSEIQRVWERLVRDEFNAETKAFFVSCM